MNRKLAIFFVFFMLFLGTNIPYLIYSALSYTEQPRKIYLYENLLFVSREYEVLTIYDVGNPEDPKKLSKIHIRTVDLAVKNGYLFADDYTDLVIYDIRDPVNPELINTIPDMFNQYNYGYDDDLMCALPPFGCSSSNDSQPSGSGTGGSMARFTIVGDYLYTVKEGTLSVFDISYEPNPRRVNEVYAGWDIETIYPHSEHYLFIGGQTGLYIYQIVDPKKPERVTFFSHATSCDPVVTFGTKAYVTLRSGNPCGVVEDQLLVLDISKMTQPRELSRYQLDGPFGLTAGEKYVFVCDGYAGVRQLNVEDHDNIYEESFIDRIVAYDIIKNIDILFISAFDGVYIYRMIDETTPTFLTGFDHK